MIFTIYNSIYHLFALYSPCIESDVIILTYITGWNHERPWPEDWLSRGAQPRHQLQALMDWRLHGQLGGGEDLGSSLCLNDVKSTKIFHIIIHYSRGIYRHLNILVGWFFSHIMLVGFMIIHYFRGVLEMGDSQVTMGFNTKMILFWMIWGCHHFRKPPCWW